MPLDNTAKLSDIISALQGIEGINAKADLASVVGSPATASDTMAAINAVIQQAKNDLAAKMDDGSSGAEPLQSLVDRLFVGKKWASGTAAFGGSLPFKQTNNNNTNTSYLNVTGLSFRPNIIILLNQLYRPSLTYAFLGIDGQNLIHVHYNNLSNYLSFHLEGNAYVTDTGFQLPHIPASKESAFWIAIE